MTIIWNHHERCIKPSTNMSGIGSLIPEIDILDVRNLRKHTQFLLGKTNDRVQSDNHVC